MGKSTISTGPFSIATLNYQRVYSQISPRFHISRENDHQQTHKILWVCPPTFYHDQPSLLGGLEHLHRLFFPSTGIFIIPTDEVILFVGIPPTRTNLQVPYFQTPIEWWGTILYDTRKTWNWGSSNYSTSNMHMIENFYTSHMCVYIYI